MGWKQKFEISPEMKFWGEGRGGEFGWIKTFGFDKMESSCDLNFILYLDFF